MIEVQECDCSICYPIQQLREGTKISCETLWVQEVLYDTVLPKCESRFVYTIVRRRETSSRKSCRPSHDAEIKFHYSGTVSQFQFRTSRLRRWIVRASLAFPRAHASKIVGYASRHLGLTRRGASGNNISALQTYKKVAGDILCRQHCGRCRQRAANASSAA